MIQNSIFTFEKFKAFPNLVHGIGTTALPGMRTGNDKHITDVFPLVDILQIDHINIVGMRQTHSDHVKSVTEKDKGILLANTDGILTDEKNVFLFGGFADCVPLLFYDPKTELIGIAHSGWKGTLSGIAEKMVVQMIEHGANAKDILVGIGPSIRDCCYMVEQDRSDMFTKTFIQPKETYITKRDEKTFLSLQNLIVAQLQTVGVPLKHIENSGICTYDSQQFFSYRRLKNKNDLQTFAALIGRI